MMRSGNRNTVKCPVPACPANWSKQSASIDEEFELRMNRFFRLQKNMSATQDSISLEDEDGYTSM